MRIYKVPHRRSVRIVRGMGAAVVLLACTAAGYGIAKLNSADWRSSLERARAVLANPHADDDDLRRAAFVIGRHEKENSTAIKGLADRPGFAGELGKKALGYIREDWR